MLVRDPGAEIATTGILELGDECIPTLERPWIPTDPGGRPFRSCVPAGLYALRKHVRPNGDKVLALVNPGLGVYYADRDRPRGVGRYLILIHAGNTVEDISGCIAPGLSATVTEAGPFVGQSRAAMRRVMSWIGDDEAEIEIRSDYE